MATEINNIVCEKCNTMYRYDASRIPPQGRKVRCSTCGHIFVAMPRTAPSARSTLAAEPDPGELSTREAARDEEEEGELQLDDEESPKRREQADAQKKNRILLRQDSTRYAVADIATLQRWIVERRVSREAELSMDGEVWERIADRTELAPFFNIVERNKTRKMTVRRDATGEFQTGSLPTAERTEGGTRTGRTRSGVRGDSVRATQVGASANASGAIPVATLETAANDTQKASSDAAKASATGPISTAANAATAASTATASASTGAKPAGTESKAPTSAQAPATELKPPVPASTAVSPSAERANSDAVVVTPKPDAMAAGVKALYTVGALILLAALAYSVLRTPASGPSTGPGVVASSPGGAGTAASQGTVTSGTAGVAPSAGMVGNGMIGSSPATGQGSAGVAGATASTNGEGKGTIPPAPELKPVAVTPKPGETVIPVPGVDASKPGETKAVAPKPTELKPTELKPTELKPGESKPPVNAGTTTPPSGPPPAPAALTPDERIAMARPIGKAEDYLKAGSSYLKREQYAQAVESLRKAAELNGSSAVIQKELGWALHHNSQVDYRNSNTLKDESVRAFQKAISLNRKYADAYYGLGVVYFELGSRNEAYRNLKAALDNGLKAKDDITEVKSFLTQLEAQGAGGQ